jgi:hypothetical protein
MTTHGKYSASGDEPHDLMVCQSLWADREVHDIGVPVVLLPVYALATAVSSIASESILGRF